MKKMHRQILNHANLLKKYTPQLIYDYTEYPTKGNWDEGFSGEDFGRAFTGWLANEENCTFYVHTPFCEELCFFCLCSKEITQDYSKVENYLYNYLFKELDLLRNYIESSGKSLNVREIFFGGGSPTYYRPKEFSALIKKLETVIDFSKIERFTVEIDPRRVDSSRLDFYSDMGVNRLSFGIQDFDRQVQEEINRIQPPALVSKLLTPTIREKFPNISFDILVGLPRQTPASMRATIAEVVAIAPEEVEPLYVHYKPGTRRYMTRMVRNVPMPDFFDRKAIYAEIVDGLEANGYERAGYENFARLGSDLSNALRTGVVTYGSTGSQTGKNPTFIAVGSSAHSMFGEYYFQNYYEQHLYRDALDQGRMPIYRGMHLSQDDLIRRNIIKFFRTYDRLKKSDFEALWGKDFDSYFSNEKSVFSAFASDGLIVDSPEELVVTPLGREFTPRICELFDKYARRQLFEVSEPHNLSNSRV